MENNLSRFYLMMIAATTLASCGSGSGPQTGPPPPVAVNVYTVKQGSASYYDQYPGTVTALNQVDIRPEVAGYISGIFFKDGQHVLKGEKLYTVDQQQYEAAYQQALANLNVSKANLDKAQQDADRYNELAKQDAIAKQVLDHAVADLQSAKMQVQAAQANVNNIQTNLRYSTICAPFEGTIGISQVKLGTAVSPGQTLLNTISSDDPVAVDIAVDDKQIAKFTKLQQGASTAADSTFSLVLPDFSRYPFPGRLSFLDRAVDPQTGTIKARLIFPNTGKVLKPGLTCNVLVLNRGEAGSILIPYKAVVEQMGEYFVFAVDSSHAKQRRLVLGARINDKVVVVDGLKVNEQIVSDGVQKLRDGVAIKIGIDSAKNGAPAMGK